MDIALALQNMLELSIVIPTYRSAGFLKNTLKEVCREMSLHIRDFEIIVVNDGNDDDVTSIALDIKKDFEKLTFVNLDKNYGQQDAVHAGLKYSKGKYIVTFDDDLQYHPRDILVLYHEIKRNDDCDIFCGFSVKKVKKSNVYSCLSKVVLFLLNRVYFPSYRKTNFFTPFKIYRKKLFEKNNNAFNFKNVYYFWEFDTNRIGYCLVQHYPRTVSSSGYSLGKLLFFFKHIVVKILLKNFYAIYFLLVILFLLNVLSPMYFWIISGVLLVLNAIFAYLLAEFRKSSYRVKSIHQWE